MNKELFTATQWILSRRNPQEYVVLADTYMEMYNRSPTNFIVPLEHEALVPVIKEFHNKLGKFVGYVRDLRDAVPKEQYADMHEMFRRVQSRYTQIERRRRLAKAVSLIEENLHKTFTYGQKKSVEKWLELYWGRERTTRLDDVRTASKNHRLSTEERAEICDLFWADLDNKLKHSIVPTPPEIVYGKLAEIESYKRQ